MHGESVIAALDCLLGNGVWTIWKSRGMKPPSGLCEHFPMGRVSSGQVPEMMDCERNKVISALTAGPGAFDLVQPLLVLL